MFHIELQAASQRLHRLNLGERELLESVLEPWVRGERIEVGDRSWSASAASILVLEGPEIPVGRLTMGRGWSVAQSEGSDVTRAMLDRVQEALTAAAAAGAQAAMAAPVLGASAQAAAPPASTAAPAIAAAPGIASLIAPADADVLADALGLELLRSLGQTPLSLLSAWKIAAKRHPQLPISVGLELSQRAVTSLVRSGLIRLAYSRDAGGHDLKDGELDAALRAIDSWSAESGAQALWLRRT